MFSLAREVLPRELGTTLLLDGIPISFMQTFSKPGFEVNDHTIQFEMLIRAAR